MDIVHLIVHFSETGHDPTSTDENDAALKALLAKLEEEENGNGGGGTEVEAPAEDHDGSGASGLDDPIPDDMPDDNPPEEESPPEAPPEDYGSGNGKQLPFTRTVPPAALPSKVRTVYWQIEREWADGLRANISSRGLEIPGLNFRSPLAAFDSGDVRSAPRVQQCRGLRQGYVHYHP